MQPKKKILFILHVPPPVHGSSVVGGFIKESTVLNDVFETRYINLGTSRSIDEIGKNGLYKVHLYFKILGSVLKQLVVFKPNVVYLAMTAKGIGFYKDLFVVLLIKLFGKQLVIHFHNKGVSDNQIKTLDDISYKLVFKNTKIILLSKYLYPDIKKYVKEDDVYYCPNGIPDLSLKHNHKPIKNDTIQLLFLSNLIESKGVFVLLDALQILKQKALKFNCNFVGGIGDISETDFRTKVQSLQLNDYVAYLGKKFDEEKTAIFKQSDIFVLPTYNETFGLVNVEAMQFALPVVSTYEGGVPAVVEDGVTGFLVPQKDVVGLADKLEVLIKNKELRIQMGLKGRKKYEQEFTLNVFESRLKTILQDITSK